MKRHLREEGLCSPGLTSHLTEISLVHRKVQEVYLKIICPFPPKVRTLQTFKTYKCYVIGRGIYFAFVRSICNISTFSKIIGLVDNDIEKKRFRRRGKVAETKGQPQYSHRIAATFPSNHYSIKTLNDKMAVLTSILWFIIYAQTYTINITGI